MDDDQWPALCSVIGADDLARDPSLATTKGRLAAIKEIETTISTWTANKNATDVMLAMQASGIPAGVVASSRYLMDEDRQLQHRGYFQVIDHPEIGESRFTSLPFLMDGERIGMKRPPLIGEHTDSVLTDILGYTPDRIAALRAEGVLE
jgi:benzylsuccinate CoA-transferase BbsF subunit